MTKAMYYALPFIAVAIGLGLAFFSEIGKGEKREKGRKS